MIFLLAIGLGMDCFAVSLGMGTICRTSLFRSGFRLVFHFGLFQGGMTFLGWLAGRTILTYISHFDHWLVFGLLGCIGMKMILESFDSKDEEAEEKAFNKSNDPTCGLSLIILSLATSLDALAVGISLALVAVNILTACLVIGMVSSGLSQAGIMIGDYLGRRFGKRMELLGGIILIGIGVKVLFSHLFIA